MKSELGAALDALKSARGNRNRVAVTGGHGYIVFSTTGPNEVIRVQATANRRLPKGIKLTPEQAGQLGDLGLRQGRASDDFQMFLARDDHDKATRVIDGAIPILTQVYGATESDICVKTLFDTVPNLDNDNLADAMSHLAKTRTWAARKGLYMTLVKTDLVCPTATEATDGPIEPYVADHIASFPVVAAFSDYASLDTYNPVGLPARVVSGMDLFPEFLARRVGSVLLNPHGQPRGELYSNELHIIVDGIKKLRGLH